MILLTPAQTAMLVDWFGEERAGPLVAQHVALTGNGACFVDRWPDPQAAIAFASDNLVLAGEPTALTPEDLRASLAGFVDAPPAFAPLLRTTFPDLVAWDRVIYDLEGPPHYVPPAGFMVRRLSPDDAYQLWALSRESAWVTKTWGGPPGLAASGMAWGAFAGDRLASVACAFFVARGYEEIGVVTEPAYRGLGLSAACAGALCGDIIARGRRPSWTTSPSNVASKRVAEKLGFAFRRRDVLYVIGVPVPA